MSSDMAAIFSKHSLRVTKPRKMIFETLKNATRPLSHVELALVNPTIDKVSVYRTIAVFLRLGIVTSVSHGWKQHYELAMPFRPHHHHLFCTQCGSVKEIQSDKLEQIIHILADLQEFKVVGHTVEITGLCGKCQDLRISVGVE